MKPINNNTRKSRITSFSILLFAAVAVIFLLLSSLWQKENIVIAKVADKKSNGGVIENDKLAQYDEQLHARLNGLEQLDEQYVVLLTTAANTKSLDSLNTVIHQEEEYFTAAVERINLSISAFTDENKRKQFVKMIASFKSVIKHRDAINSLRTTIAFKNDDSNPDIIQWQKMQDELTAKNNKIKMLENSILNFRKGKVQAIPVTNNKNTPAPAGNISSLPQPIATMATVNNLKQNTNAQLKQKTATSKISSKNELLLKETTNSLQQKIDLLNAEIQLTRVDCNLLKVNATPAISNAQQRKQLLSEASSILTDLSKTDNTEIKRKVKDKMFRLNQVAANTGD